MIIRNRNSVPDTISALRKRANHRGNRSKMKIGHPARIATQDRLEAPSYFSGRSAAVPCVSGSVIRRDSKLESARIHGRRTVDVRSLSGKPRGWSSAGCVPYFYHRQPPRFHRAAYPPCRDTLSSSERVAAEWQRGRNRKREREREGVKTSLKHVRPWTQDQRNFKHANLKFLSSAVVVTLLLTMLNWFLGWVMG